MLAARHFSITLRTLFLAGSLCLTLIIPLQAEAAERGVTVHQDLKNGQLVSVGPDGKLIYKPYTDQGDRVMDYSYAGYKASLEPIPDVATTLILEPLPDTPTPERRELPDPKPETFMAYPDGPDSYERIQAALDQVADMPKGEDGFCGAVLLKKGAYYLKSGLSVEPGVVLRGEGDDWGGTVLVFHNPGGTGISLRNSQIEDKQSTTPHKTRIADAYVPVASRSVIVEDLGPLKKGDHIWVIKTPNQAWVDTLGMNPPGPNEPAGGGNKPWTPEGYRSFHPRTITGIGGNRVSFYVPLPQSIVAEHGGGEVVLASGRRFQAPRGVEGLRIVSNYNRAVRIDFEGNNNRAPGIYEADEEDNLSTAISVAATNVWVRDCTMMHQMKSAVSLGNGTIFSTIRDCTSLEPISVRRGGRRYCYSLNTGASMVLIYQCTAEKGRHSFVLNKRVNGPNAFVRCYQSEGNMEAHQRWATGILFDKSVNTSIWGAALQNRRGMGSGHGWAGANGVIWNYKGGVTIGNPQTPEQNFAIGCIVPEYAKGGSEVRGDGYIWSEGTHVKPDSLFEAQLAERIGKRWAMEILAK